MTQQPPTLHKYRVLCAVTRAEYYEIEAASESEAERTAFEDGNHVRVDAITEIVACETVEIAEFAPPITAA